MTSFLFQKMKVLSNQVEVKLVSGVSGSKKPSFTTYTSSLAPFTPLH